MTAKTLFSALVFLPALFSAQPAHAGLDQDIQDYQDDVAAYNVEFKQWEAERSRLVGEANSIDAEQRSIDLEVGQIKVDETEFGNKAGLRERKEAIRRRILALKARIERAQADAQRSDAVGANLRERGKALDARKKELESRIAKAKAAKKKAANGDCASHVNDLPAHWFWAADCDAGTTIGFLPKEESPAHAKLLCERVRAKFAKKNEACASAPCQWACGTAAPAIDGREYLSPEEQK